MEFSSLPPVGSWELIVATALITVAITLSATLFFKKLVIPIVTVLIKPLLLIKEMIYRWFALRNPVPISLWNYRRHVLKSWLARIENPVGPAIEVSLESAFAPLRLVSSDEDRNIDLLEHAGEHYRTMILGGAGTGKTTLMKSLVVNILTNSASPRLNDLIPVFIRLRHLGTRQHSVMQAIIAAFEDFHFAAAEKFVESAVNQGKLLIVLDGLDEVGVNRTEVAEAIQDFCEKDEQRDLKNRVIVTCREHGYRTQDLQSAIKVAVRVEPFSNHHMRIFLQGWPEHNGKAPINLYSKIQDDPRIVEICRNPLLLTILTGLFLEIDAENFKMPSSRDSFYNACLNELLVQRPARKKQTQKFDADLKLRTLASSSLDRLETASLTDDPEELHIEIIRKHAIKAFMKKEDDLDILELINELTETNAILKHTGASTYTFAHRTIQEYLAAQEALRTRTTDQVLTHFGSPQDLNEVLLFYCSLNRNIPQLSEVLAYFASADEWRRPGECLINMQEVPDIRKVTRICTELYGKIVNLDDHHSNLEVLASIAQLHGDEVGTARELFSKAIDFLSLGMEHTGTTALESVLATKPKMAFKVISALRGHGSPSVRSAAVRMLRDIGTDEALDQLIEIIGGPDKLEKTEAARMLASLISTRKDELLKRAMLFKDRRDSAVWPLEDYFPGRLALPIAEAISKEETKSGDPAINVAAQAIREQRKGIKFLPQWKNVLRDARLRHIERFIEKTFDEIFFWGSGLYILTYVLFTMWGQYSGQHFIVESNPIAMYSISSKKLEKVRLEAIELRTRIRSLCPPNATGFSRVLPWNWSVEPIVPPSIAEGYKHVNRLSEIDFEPYYLSAAELDSLEALVYPNEIQRLTTAIHILQEERLPSRDTSYTAVGTMTPWSGIVFMLIVVTILVANLLARVRHPDDYLYSRGLFLVIAWLGFLFMLIHVRGSHLLVLAPFGLFGFFLLCSNLLGLRPRNPYLKDITHLVPSSLARAKRFHHRRAPRIWYQQ